MATTRIMPVHIAKEWGAAQSIKRAVDYAMNPEKTDDGLLVTGFECDLNMVSENFGFTRDDYNFKKGREQGDNEIVAYHVRQSFAPGEISDTDVVNKLGFDLAMELTSGNNAFIVCTHNDKHHLHNHILINAVNLDCDKKFRNEIGSFRRVQRISDRLCKEHNLSVVLEPKPSKNYSLRYAATTKRDIFVKLIDDVLANKQPKDFDDFLKHLERAGCKIKRRGNTISVKPPDAERFFRFRSGQKSLPEGYDEESLRLRIADIQSGLQEKIEKSADEIFDTDSPISPASELSSEIKSTPTAEKNNSAPSEKIITPPALASSIQIEIPNKKIGLIIDIENSLKAKDSIGYQRWAERFNLQQAAETLLFLQTNNLTDIDDLYQAAANAKTDLDALQKYINTADARIKNINNLQRHIGAYNKNRDIYSEYLRSKRSPKFRQDNEKAIAAVEEAKKYFDSLGLDKLPSIKDLQAEYSALFHEQQNNSEKKLELSRYITALDSSIKNIELLLRIEPQRNNQQSKNKRSADER